MGCRGPRARCTVAWVFGAIFGNDFAVSTASDIFFDQDAGLRRASQLTQASKLELRANFGGSLGDVSFGSINRHGTHFATPMEILSGGQAATSLCFGLGLDRYVRLLAAKGIADVSTLIVLLRAQYIALAQEAGLAELTERPP